MNMCAGLIAVLMAVLPNTSAPDPTVAMQDVAQAAINRWPGGDTRQDNRPYLWTYTKSVMLTGFQDAAAVTTDPRYDAYIRSSMDLIVDEKGDIKDFPNEPHSLDQIPMGRQLLYLFNKTHEQKYAIAAHHVMDQLNVQPRNRAGGFWHKQIYPGQMWLDGLYMAEPFYAEFAVTFHDPSAFEDIAHQFTLSESKTRDPRTGLLFHGWDESRQQPWADKKTGLSPSFWARSMGWYAMALVDTLPYFPEGDPGRKQLLDILQRMMPALLKVQDAETGLWWQVLDRPRATGNYLEASSSAMFLYALEKGVRLGYLPATDLVPARKGWNGFCSHFLQRDEHGVLHITGIVRSGGLGGSPYRSGTYEYYTSEKIVVDDPQGIGAFLMLASETTRLHQ